MTRLNGAAIHELFLQQKRLSSDFFFFFSRINDSLAQRFLSEGINERSGRYSHDSPSYICI